MIRLTALWLVVGLLVTYSRRDWYRALCGLILLMAVVEHPDMPKSMFGIQGLNPWNIALLSITLAWASSRGREQLRWDLPGWVSSVLVAYLGVVVVGFTRLILDKDALDPDATVLALTSEYLVNSIKWVVPGLLLFDGCRSHERLSLGVMSFLGVYFLLAVQVVRWMYPYAGLGGEELQARALRVLLNEVGYHRVNLSTMFAGASWAVLASRPLLPPGLRGALICYGGMITIVGAQTLTAGRAGYATWAALGLVLGALRWRRYLLLAPAVVLAVASVAPGVTERLMTGFTDEDRAVESPFEGADSAEIEYDDKPGANLYLVTSGRNLIWPFVIAKIEESPLVGYGREAMTRTGLRQEMGERFGEAEAFPHPHNAYLEWLLDNGWIGFSIILIFYGYVLWVSVRLFQDRRWAAAAVTGGISLALVGSLLMGAIGSQTFYPREGWVGMWCAIGLLLRLRVQQLAARARLRAQTRQRGRRHEAAPMPMATLEEVLWSRAS